MGKFLLKNIRKNKFNLTKKFTYKSHNVQKI